MLLLEGQLKHYLTDDCYSSSFFFNDFFFQIGSKCFRFFVCLLPYTHVLLNKNNLVLLSFFFSQNLKKFFYFCKASKMIKSDENDESPPIDDAAESKDQLTSESNDVTVIARPNRLTSSSSSQNFDDQSSRLITTTRFLHPSSSNIENSCSPSPNRKLTKEASLSKLSTPVTTKNIVDELPAANQSEQLSQSSMVAKLKSWIGLRKPPNEQTGSKSGSDASSLLSEQQNKQQLNEQFPTPVTNSHSPYEASSYSKLNNGSTTNSYESISNFSFSYIPNSETTPNLNMPLSIDLICKLKKPSSVPQLLEYNNGQTFQGTVLEEWIMQSLDEYIQNPITAPSNSQQVNNMLTPFGRNLSQSNNGKQQMSEKLKVNNSTPSTATTSATSIVIESHDEQQQQQQRPANLNLADVNRKADDPSAVDYTCTTPNEHQQQPASNASQNLFINNLLKRQEANFFVHQILTDLLALGVLEYASGFENAINKTFKVNIYCLNSRGKKLK